MKPQNPNVRYEPVNREPQGLEALANHPLRFAAREFSRANNAYKELVGIPAFREYERSWRTFLHHIERVWNKTQAISKGRPHWQKIESETTFLRKNDPLLLYITHARNSDEHSISELLNEWRPDVKAITHGKQIKLTWTEWDRPLLPITSRGNYTVQPPTTHLGVSIQTLKGKGQLSPELWPN
jgi:hypothetical protein